MGGWNGSELYLIEVDLDAANVSGTNGDHGEEPIFPATK